MTRYLTNFKYYGCRVLDKIGILKFLSFSLPVRFGTQTLTVPVRGQVGYPNLLAATEPWMSIFIKRCLMASSGTVVDVGMNVGQTILKAALLDREMSYVGFEPNPICYAYCKDLVEKNQLNGFSIFPVGLSNRVEVATLFGDKPHASGASILGDFRENKEKYQEIHRVPVMPGDAILREEAINDVSLIKLDIEGAELEALQGMRETLQRTGAPVILEILPVYTLEKLHLRKRKKRQDELMGFMRALDYKAYLILEDSKQLEPLDEIPVHSDMSRTNYIFLQDQSYPFFKDLLVVPSPAFKR